MAARDLRWLSPFVKKAELHFETPLTKGTQYLFAVHPHGVASWHHGVLLGNTSTPPFSDFVPGDQRRHLGASVVFRIPLWREFMLYFGVVDASKHVAHAVLKSGKTLVILVGGVIEQMMAKRGEHLIYVKHRKGHCKLAIQHGTAVVPVYCFGETDMFETSTFLLPFRQWVAKKFSVALPICWGPYWWCPIYPFDVEYHHVFGNPIPTTKTDHPTQEDIDRVHKQYVAELERIFEKYKAQFGYPEATLHVC
ncbi:hypothetical protein H257_02194 [Aphanomyces astaci]|uniref:diacylglycerol O-acyltransferase n=1 Tax=Aphanomyces astaci TaxID=112090 RepID=W4H7Y0_APHAT|nr:hypothetical protein H257_02194 [Aphanomyces astaci]ETV87233.1 hypothetical protein H257_02194 [Aphanomyces astaci]|eukprot:XP_009824032.1 hypothetical protein H257_02194 [Aphanomyces astaci]